MKRPRFLVIGLDCAAPELVFERFLSRLPVMRGLIEHGIAGRLRSTDPPITVPAWTAMMTSKDPGQLGLYGFRNRTDYSYDGLAIANSTHVKEKTVWNYLTEAGLSSLLVGVPQTYPIRPIRGLVVSDFLTPSKNAQWTFPAAEASRVDRLAGGDYIIDVPDFRIADRAQLREQIFEMTRRRFRAFRALLDDGYDFCMLVEIGLDRMHHGFWRYMDRGHRLYEPDSPFAQAIRDYYELLDAEIGQTIAACDDQTSVMVVSDHGAKSLKGAIAINEFFIEKGLLALKEKPGAKVPLQSSMVDWSRTKCWGEGGYYSRVFFNIAGREPAGQVKGEELDGFRSQVIDLLRGIADERGVNIGTKVLIPEETYRAVTGCAPDLIAYLGNLDWRSSSVVGLPGYHLFENDTGPDDANHAMEGILIWRPPKGATVHREEVYSIYDIAPTILNSFNIEVPTDMIGKSLFGD